MHAELHVYRDVVLPCRHVLSVYAFAVRAWTLLARSAPSLGGVRQKVNDSGIRATM